MALLNESCQVLAAVEEFQPSIKVPEGDSSGEDQQTYSKLLPQTELSAELVSELTRQESCVSTDSLGTDDSPQDADESSSDGGLDLDPRGHRSASVVSDASEEGGRDSGIEAEKEPDMVVPDQDLIDRIVTQVEIYFSDASVMKDKFLLKHIRRNKEGYVSLKLVSSFKKIKQLTKDWRVVAHALNKGSTNIQINDLGTKIRRTTALPEIDDSPVTCTVLALNLALEKPGIDTVSQLFAKCGDMALIRVLRAGAPLSAELKTLASKYPSLNNTNCAWIEFEATEAVKEACKLSSNEGMKVVPIIPESVKKTEKPTQQKSQPNSRKTSVTSQNYNNQQRGGPNSRKNSIKYNKMNNEQENMQQQRPIQQRRKAISLFHTQRPNLRDLTVIVEGRRRPKSKSCVEFSPGQGSSNCPGAASSWVQRHLFAAAVASAAAAAGAPINYKPPSSRPSRVSLGTLSLPEGVARFPKGPDGSKGFGARRISQVVN
uniref:La-related protein 6-like n=1 Tax=Hirondellea gigas TaxID=1518452 RepID=A0A6A7G2Q0_9CRUS